MTTPSPALLTNALPRFDQVTARRLFLSHHGLLAPPWPAPDTTEGHLNRLGFVQVDSVCTVLRAHDMILTARHKPFRPNHFSKLLERDRRAFEHWTHDAAILPISAYPHWRHKMARDAEVFLRQWQTQRRGDFEAQFDPILKKIASDGPVSTRDVGQDEQKSRGGWWDWAPSKTALEFLWRRGDLAITGRKGFRKIYDLTERVVPDAALLPRPDLAETVNWAAKGALARLGFATSGEIAAFYDLLTPEEAKSWTASALARDDISLVEVADGTGGWRKSVAAPDLIETVRKDGRPDGSTRLRILSPFDPAIRDRKRAKRLFDFDYRIEIFVPEAQRRYGYYVFPVLDGCRFVGRIDMKVDRSTDELVVLGYWPETGAGFGRDRQTRLVRELYRYGRLTGVSGVSVKRCAATEILSSLPL